MFFLRVLMLAFVVAISCGIVQAEDKDVQFPTDEEIRLVLTQAGRAIDQYKPLLDMEQKAFGKEGADAVAKDREVVQAIEMAIKGFSKNPQAFNGPLGFAFFEWLDDASRNASLCSGSALGEAGRSALARDTDTAESDIQLSQNCTSVSTLLYTVSENAGALYTRYIKGEQRVAEEGARVAARCAEILKQKSIVPK